MSQGAADSVEVLPCAYQVGGHKTKDGLPQSYVDAEGRFYKPLQEGARAKREAAFYKQIADAVTSASAPTSEAALGQQTLADLSALATLIPGYYGIKDVNGVSCLILEDQCKGYSKPCVMDVKMGYSTVYDWADDHYKEKNIGKDDSSTQASAGYRICGYRVYKQAEDQYAEGTRIWGKSLTKEDLPEAFRAFSNNGALSVADVYSGPDGVIAQLQKIEQWFLSQRSVQFFAASVLISFEGTAKTAQDANVRIKLVDFAHTFVIEGEQDVNVLTGLQSLIGTVQSIV